MKCPKCKETFDASSAGFPPPAEPPCTIMKSGLFGGEKETEESKIGRARHEGASGMWDKFMKVILAD